MKNQPEGNKGDWVWQLTFGEIHKALNSCQSNILKMTIAGQGIETEYVKIEKRSNYNFGQTQQGNFWNIQFDQKTYE